MTKNDGGEAFPTNHENQVSGMSLRDYFAGQALVGLAARDQELGKDINLVALVAYAFADAMIREKGDL